MDAVTEISAVLKEIEDYLKEHDDDDDDDTDRLLQEKKKLERDLAIYKKHDLNTKPSDQPKLPSLDDTSEKKLVLKSQHGRTDLEIFSTADEEFEVILKPKLELLKPCKDFFFTFKTDKNGTPAMLSTNLPCFIPFCTTKTTDLTEYTLGIVKKLECYLLRKDYVNLTEMKFSSMCCGEMKTSFPCDFVYFDINIDSEVAAASGNVEFRIHYNLDGTCAKDVFVRLKGSQKFISLVEKDIMEESLAFKSQNLYDAFCQIFESKL